MKKILTISLIVFMSLFVSLQSFSQVLTFRYYELVRIRNIVYCKAEGNYSNVYTVSGEVIVVSKALKFLEDLLPGKIFFRPHKSYLINLNYIKSINRSNGGEILLENGSLIPLAKSQFKSLLEQLQRATN